MSADWLAEHLDIFFGRSTEVVTDVYLRLPRSTPWGSHVYLSGQILGPFCEGIRTLPGKSYFTDLGPGPTLLARATVPDLAFWSMDRPFLYRVTAQLNEQGATLAEVSVWWGCHRLTLAGKNMAQGPQPIFLAAVRTLPQQLDWGLWRSWKMAVLIEDPSDDFLSQADRQGLPVVCRVNGPLDEVSRKARYWARHASVWLLITEPWDTSAFDPVQHTPNLIWAAFCSSATTVPRPDPPALVLEPAAFEQLNKYDVYRAIFLLEQRPALADNTEILKEADRRRQSWDGRVAGYIIW